MGSLGICVVAACLLLASGIEAEDNSTLRLLFALWRHGDRAPVETYPTDPYKDSEYLPEGKGHLNVRGKKRAYDLGLYMKSRYGSFLGSEMLPNTAVLRTTAVPRTIESGNLVMAALFPPAADQKWDSGNSSIGQLWEPVAFTSEATSSDRLLYPYGTSCASLYTDAILGAAVAKSKLEEIVSEGNVAEILKVNASISPDNLEEVAMLGDTLIAQESCGLELPSWTSEVYPEPLTTILGMFEGIFVYTKRQRKIMGGTFLYNLVNDSLAYQSGELPDERKLYAFSAHDMTDMAVLAALGVWDGRVPPYSAAIFIELWEKGDNGTLGFQVLYRNDTSAEPLNITLPGCDFFCPLDTFQELYKDFILTSDEITELCDDGDK